MRSFGFRATLGLYYLALGTWFGTTLMMGIAAGTTFRTVREFNPTLSVVPNTVLNHGEYLAGEAVNRGFTAMSTIQTVCAVIVVLLVFLQVTRWRSPDDRRWANRFRIGLIVFAMGVLGGDLAYLRRHMGSLRATMYDEAAPGTERDGARAAFATAHKVSERLLGAASLAVGAAVLVSPFALTGGPSRTSET